MFSKTEQRMQIIELLKTLYDPELPINIWDLGLIYAIDINDDGNINIAMTLTSPNCPAIDILPQQVEEIVQTVTGGEVYVDLVWDPSWSQSLISEEAKLDLGLI